MTKGKNQEKKRRKRLKLKKKKEVPKISPFKREVAAILPKSNQKFSQNSRAYIIQRNTGQKLKEKGKFINKKSSLHIGSLNIRGGFNTKKLLILQAIEENNLDILIISETHFNDDRKPDKQLFNRFKIFEKHRTTQRGGGVALLISNELASEEMIIDGNEEIVLSKVYFRDEDNALSSIIIAGLYCTRSVSSTNSSEDKLPSAHRKMTNIQTALLNKLGNYNGNNLIIGGDFNLTPKYVEQTLGKTISKYDLLRIPSKSPTREAKIIDHILVPKYSLQEENVKPALKFTDHKLVTVKLAVKGRFERLYTTIYSIRKQKSFWRSQIKTITPYPNSSITSKKKLE